jgi:hypothetical protein
MGRLEEHRLAVGNPHRRHGWRHGGHSDVPARCRQNPYTNSDQPTKRSRASPRSSQGFEANCGFKTKLSEKADTGHLDFVAVHVLETTRSC